MAAHDEILTIPELAAELRCSKTHVCNLINGKLHGVPRLPAIAMGRRKVVRRSTLEHWLRAVEEGRDMLPTLPETAAGRMVKGEYRA